LLAQMLLKVYQRLALKIKKFYLTWKDYTLNDKKNSIHFLRNRNLNKVDTKHYLMQKPKLKLSSSCYKINKFITISTCLEVSEFFCSIWPICGFLIQSKSVCAWRPCLFCTFTCVFWCLLPS
jgi:hypothetical protein